MSIQRNTSFRNFILLNTMSLPKARSVQTFKTFIELSENNDCILYAWPSFCH